MHLLGLSSEAKSNTLKKRASSATLGAQNTATELGWDRDNASYCTDGRLACPSAESAGKKLGRRKTSSQKKVRTFYAYSYAPICWKC